MLSKAGLPCWRVKSGFVESNILRLYLCELRRPRGRVNPDSAVGVGVRQRARRHGIQADAAAMGDIQKWLGQGSIGAGVLAQVRDELLEIAIALDTGAPISPMSEIPLPPQPRRRGLSRQRDRELTFDDDEIPF